MRRHYLLRALYLHSTLYAAIYFLRLWRGSPRRFGGPDAGRGLFFIWLVLREPGSQTLKYTHVRATWLSVAATGRHLARGGSGYIGATGSVAISTVIIYFFRPWATQSRPISRPPEGRPQCRSRHRVCSQILKKHGVVFCLFCMAHYAHRPPETLAGQLS